MNALIETDRLVLRQPTPSDWEAFRDFMMSERARGNGGPYGLGPAWRMFAAELGHWVIQGCGMWAVTRKGSDAPLGLIGPWTPADWPETEIGWMILDPHHEGQGFAYEAARAAIDHAFHTLKWDTVVHYIAPWNTRSIALAERLGSVLDRDAPQPKPDDPCLVYRHPKPEIPA